MNLHFETGKIHLIQGSNGTGKSTFLKILTGAMDPTEGQVHFNREGQRIELEEIWPWIGFVAPYQELPEELRLPELIEFQCRISENQFPEPYSRLIHFFGIDKDLHKPIRNFSTGMKQKARFVLGLGSERPIWILDEPGSNLDPESTSRFWQILEREKKERLIIVASNEPEEFKRADILISLH